MSMKEITNICRSLPFPAYLGVPSVGQNNSVIKAYNIISFTTKYS